MSSSGYIKMLDTVMTFQLGVCISQNLCRYSESYAICKTGANPQVSNLKKKSFQHTEPDYSQFPNDDECRCCTLSCITLHPCKVDTLSLTTYIRNSAVWVPICASLHLFLPHQNTVRSTHSPHIAVG